ncbi:class I lanthipeptide [Aquimarina sp. RZ0]|uniref:class I lanthipeptide n=1 Tax=Aquimarina sp. RZ0 TaxID=2607730 RepID=UPI00165FD4AD|nr:class I lanthipeptide [Aquimarina sp. RZ0]
MKTNPKKLQLTKITISKLHTHNMKRIRGGSDNDLCQEEKTKQNNDPNCQGSEQAATC